MSNGGKQLATKPVGATGLPKTRSNSLHQIALPLQSSSATSLARPPRELNTGANDMLRLAQVVDLTSLSRATIYRLVGIGQFPKPIRLSLGRVAWLKRDVVGWLSRR